MRFSILLLSVLFVFGCSTKNAHEDDAEIITKIGVITAREDASMNDVEKDKNVSTSGYGSVSSGSGGSGVSIGIGVLLSSFLSGDSDQDLVRYEVDLNDGGQFTIYHDSRDFEVEDCVEITVYPDEDKHPPTMKRNKDAC